MFEFNRENYKDTLFLIDPVDSIFGKSRFTCRATATRTKTFVDGATALAAEINAEFDNLLGALALVNADVSASAAIASSKISGTAVTLAGTETLTNKTVGDTLSMTTGAITQAGTAAHITLTPGTGKLVRVAVLRQTNTTNAYQNNSIILTGWGVITGVAGTVVNEAVTFGITFDAAPIVLSNSLDTHGGAPDSIDDFVSNFGAIIATKTVSISTTGFTVYAYTETGQSFDGHNPGYSWIAIGALA